MLAEWRQAKPDPSCPVKWGVHMEFTVLNQTEILNLPSVQWNFDDLKKYALEKAEEYKGIAYTEDDVKAMKADRADINRFINAIEDERKQKEEEQVKQLSKLIEKEKNSIV